MKNFLFNLSQCKLDNLIHSQNPSNKTPVYFIPENPDRKNIFPTDKKKPRTLFNPRPNIEMNKVGLANGCVTSNFSVDKPEWQDAISIAPDKSPKPCWCRPSEFFIPWNGKYWTRSEMGSCHEGGFLTQLTPSVSSRNMYISRQTFCSGVLNMWNFGVKFGLCCIGITNSFNEIVKK